MCDLKKTTLNTSKKKKNKENERNEEYSKNVGVRPTTKPEYEKKHLFCTSRTP